MNDPMKIALVADDENRRALLDWVRLHSGTLADHELFAVGASHTTHFSIMGVPGGVIPLRAPSPPPAMRGSCKRAREAFRDVSGVLARDCDLLSEGFEHG